jgi:hypothetical protein
MSKLRSALSTGIIVLAAILGGLSAGRPAHATINNDVGIPGCGVECILHGGNGGTGGTGGTGGGGGGTREECPSGSTPKCNQCSGNTCVSACEGDFACIVHRDGGGRADSCIALQTLCHTL